MSALSTHHLFVSCALWQYCYVKKTKLNWIVWIQQALTRGSSKRLQCFAHTLQLAIGDGLKEAKVARVPWQNAANSVLFCTHLPPSEMHLKISLARKGSLLLWTHDGVQPTANWKQCSRLTSRNWAMLCRTQVSACLLLLLSDHRVTFYSCVIKHTGLVGASWPALE